MAKKLDMIIGMIKKLGAEFLSTFALVFIGAGAVMTNEFTSGAVGIIGIAFAHGLTLWAMIAAFANISGAHVNPAVTVGMWVAGKIRFSEGIGYISFQLAGAAIAGFLLTFIFGGPLDVHAGTTSLASGIGPVEGLVVEIILTFFLALTIFLVAVRQNLEGYRAGIFIGSVIIFDILMGGALTGASMNPARTFGPAVASGFFNYHWIYWAGPIIGALLVALPYRLWSHLTNVKSSKNSS